MSTKRVWGGGVFANYVYEPKRIIIKLDFIRLGRRGVKALAVMSTKNASLYVLSYYLNCINLSEPKARQEPFKNHSERILDFGTYFGFTFILILQLIFIY